MSPPAVEFGVVGGGEIPQIVVPAPRCGELAQPGAAQPGGQGRIGIGLQELPDLGGGQFRQAAGEFLVAQVGIERIGPQHREVDSDAVAERLVGDRECVAPGRKRFGRAHIAADTDGERDHQHRPPPALRRKPPG